MPSYLITGASRGLGYAWLKHLSSNPANTVIGLVRNKAATSTRLAADGITTAHLVSADITDASALRLAAAQVSQLTGGTLDVLINNAALSSEATRFKTLADLAPAVLERELAAAFRTNVVGVALTVHAFLPLIRRGALRKVVAVSSLLADADVAARLGLGIAAPYAVSKAALNCLVAKYHAALGAAEGIVFMALSPGAVAKAAEAQGGAAAAGGGAGEEEEVEGRRAMGAKFREYAPHFEGPIAAEESVRMQLEVIDRATVETYGGEFVSHFGNKQWL